MSQSLELNIKSIGELKKEYELEIPPYQRPYSWSRKSANTLFSDTYSAYDKDSESKYRLGSVILYKDGEKRFFVVDGQQRLITLSILLFCLDEKEDFNLLKKDTIYSAVSNDAIVDNYRLLSSRTKSLKKAEDYKKYLLNNCTVVLIETDKEQEAFQFFDSQNFRGKDLAPHDLLKSYHLREMNDVSRDKKVEIINKWENLAGEQLDSLFQDYLYPIIKWQKKRSGLNYSKKEIETFKGITLSNVSDYALYHKASHLFIEQFNQDKNREFLGCEEFNQFQLTQPIIAGIRFFSFTLHYMQLLKDIKAKVNKNYKVDEVPETRTGDRYVRRLYECVLLFIADRFGLKAVTDEIMHLTYKWCYILRLQMRAVYLQTINNYACGDHSGERYGITINVSPMFEFISEMKTLDELNTIVFEIGVNNKIKDLEEALTKNDSLSKYEAIYNKGKAWETVTLEDE